MRKNFKESDKVKMLLWSGRHCCICKKACGDSIEIAHIDPPPKGGNDIDNGIPVCHDHHIEIGRYNDKHPLGNKWRIKELKKIRDQAYEEYTKHLIPKNVSFEITQVIRGNPLFPLRKFPNVGFNLSVGDSPPIRAKVEVKIILGKRNLGIIRDETGYYSGGTEWNLQPNSTTFGNFSVTGNVADSTKDLWIEVRVTLIDQLDRLHKLPPLCWKYVREHNHWYLEPRQFTKWT
jgi:hypothetical protein